MSRLPPTPFTSSTFPRPSSHYCLFSLEWAKLSLPSDAFSHLHGLSRRSCFPGQKENSEWGRSRISEMLNSTLKTWQEKSCVSLGRWGSSSSLFIFMLNSLRMNRLISWFPCESLGLIFNTIVKKTYSFYWIFLALVFLPTLRFLSTEKKYQKTYPSSIKHSMLGQWAQGHNSPFPVSLSHL